MVLSGQALNALLAQRELSAACTAEEEVLLELAPGANAAVAETMGLVQEVRLALLFSELRKLEQPWLIPVGIRGFVVELED